jgi:hypothetical protein
MPRSGSRTDVTVGGLKMRNGKDEGCAVRETLGHHGSKERVEIRPTPILGRTVCHSEPVEREQLLVVVSRRGH